MKTLLINTSQSDMQVLLLNGTQVFSASKVKCNLNHSVVLFGAVDEVLSSSGISLSQLDNIAVVVGPGSFTGIRVGISVAKGYATVFDKIKFISVNSLELVAYTTSTRTANVAITAGKGFYFASYDNGREIISPSYDNQLPSGFTDVLDYQHCTGLNDAFVKIVLDCIADNKYVATLTPLYLQLSQAERELNNAK